MDDTDANSLVEPSAPFITLCANGMQPQRPGVTVQSDDDRIPKVTPRTHDTSFSIYHASNIDQFAAHLDKAAEGVFPNRGPDAPRYRSAQVVLIEWEDDKGLGTSTEVEWLSDVFQNGYGFDTTTWKIPTEDPLSSIMNKALALRREIDTEETLIIVYYGGHAFMNEDRQQMWARTNRTNEGQLEWYAVQPLFMRAKSDVLFLLDCCSAASAATKVRDVVGTKETIAACGFESKAPEPGAHSYTSELIDILTKWQNDPFSVAMLSSELLSNLKHHKPKPDMFNKVVESRSSPTHYFTTVNPRTPSIILRRHIRKQEIVEECRSRKRRRVSVDSSPAEVTSVCGSSIPACTPTVSDSNSEVFSSSEDIESNISNYSRERMNEVLPDGDLLLPHVLLTLALEGEQFLNIDGWKNWLASCPALVKHARIEGRFKSHSTMLLLSVPVVVWNLLPPNLACSFVGYVRSVNLSPNMTWNNVHTSSVCEADSARSQSPIAVAESPYETWSQTTSSSDENELEFELSAEQTAISDEIGEAWFQSPPKDLVADEEMAESMYTVPVLARDASPDLISSYAGLEIAMPRTPESPQTRAVATSPHIVHAENPAWVEAMSLRLQSIVEAKDQDLINELAANREPSPRHDFRPVLADTPFSLSPFVYAPLDSNSREIRIVTIEPGRFDHAIRLVLKHEPLDTNPCYEALSHTWGSAEDPVTILVNGQYMSVRRDLGSALHYIRSETTFRSIWVDAICINQSDVQERSHQVELLRSVFQNASSVVVWLGEETALTHAAIELMKYHKLQIESEVLPTQEINEELSSELIQVVESGIFNRKYWSRLWIVQELAVAGEVLVLCGSSSIALPQIFVTVRLVRRYLHSRWDKATTFTINNELHQVEQCWHIEKSITRLEQIGFLIDSYRSEDLASRNIDVLLMRCSNMECSDPHDKVFALLGISEISDELLYPDYSLSLDMLYTRLARIAFERRMKLDMMTLATNKGRYNMPSWVPDWSSASDMGSVTSSILKENISWGTLFNADGGSQPKISFSDDNRTLHVNGIFHDNLVSIAAPLSLGAKSTLPDFLQTALEMATFAQDRTRNKKSDEEIRAAVLRSLVFDLDWKRRRCPKNEGPEDIFMSQAPLVQGSQRMTRGMLSVMLETNYDRSFATTEKGQFGLVPEGTVPGDMVCILFGSQVPMILRRHGENYTFIGPCYIHGIMDGEALAGRDYEDEIREFSVI